MNPYKGAAVRVVDDEQARHVYDARLLLEPEALARAVTTPPPHHRFRRPKFPAITGEPVQMSFTPAVAETLRQALATVVVVPVTPLHASWGML